MPVGAILHYHSGVPEEIPYMLWRKYIGSGNNRCKCYKNVKIKDRVGHVKTTSQGSQASLTFSAAVVADSG